MKKPIVNEVFTDNGEHSHWNLIDAETGENLWSESSEENELLAQLDKWIKECSKTSEMFKNNNMDIASMGSDAMMQAYKIVKNYIHNNSNIIDLNNIEYNMLCARETLFPNKNIEEAKEEINKILHRDNNK